jgi:8-oxo-dGTP diphosphatase
MSHQYQYPRPALTVDCVVFGFDEGDLQLLLIERAHEPFAGRWALPGGFVQMDEPLDSAAFRELREETGLHDIYLEQLYTFGDPDRDPRERVVSVAYYALVSLNDHPTRAASDASRTCWFGVAHLPALAFDHDAIIEMALHRLKGKIRYEPIGFELLPHCFTLSELQRLYEAILEVRLDKRNFRKKILSMGLLKDTGTTEKDVPRRAARLYRFDEPTYRSLQTKGFNFEL